MMVWDVYVKEIGETKREIIFGSFTDFSGSLFLFKKKMVKFFFLSLIFRKSLFAKGFFSLRCKNVFILAKTPSLEFQKFPNILPCLSIILKIFFPRRKKEKFESLNKSQDSEKRSQKKWRIFFEEWLLWCNSKSIEAILFFPNQVFQGEKARPKKMKDFLESQSGLPKF